MSHDLPDDLTYVRTAVDQLSWFDPDELYDDNLAAMNIVERAVRSRLLGLTRKRALVVICQDTDALRAWMAMRDVSGTVEYVYACLSSITLDGAVDYLIKEPQYVRIISPPDGEAPEEVRRAWVGMTLPLDPTYEAPVSVRVRGVLTGPHSYLMSLVAVALGRGGQHELGYMVLAEEALELLAEHAPSAEAWWREHTPHLYRPRERLLFHDYTCRLVDRPGLPVKQAPS